MYPNAQRHLVQSRALASTKSIFSTQSAWLPICSKVWHGTCYIGWHVTWASFWRCWHRLVSWPWSCDPVPNFCHKRVVAVELQSESHKFLLISVYMPFYDASNSEKCLAETQDALSMIDLLIENHPFHLIIIGGDLNTELKGESPFDTLWTEMMTRNALASCSSLFSLPGYTCSYISYCFLHSW